MTTLRHVYQTILNRDKYGVVWKTDSMRESVGHKRHHNNLPCHATASGSHSLADRFRTAPFLDLFLSHFSSSSKRRYVLVRRDDARSFTCASKA